jgi:hypothetical protein
MLDAGPGLGLTDEVNATHHDHSATMTTSVMQMPSMARRMEDSAPRPDVHVSDKHNQPVRVNHVHKEWDD